MINRDTSRLHSSISCWIFFVQVIVQITHLLQMLPLQRTVRLCSLERMRLQLLAPPRISQTSLCTLKTFLHSEALHPEWGIAQSDLVLGNCSDSTIANIGLANHSEIKSYSVVLFVCLTVVVMVKPDRNRLVRTYLYTSEIRRT